MSSSNMKETPVDAEYDPLPPAEPDTDLDPKAHIPIVRSARRNGKSTIRRSSLLIRIGAFIVIESAFIILAALAMSKPIPLHTSSVSLTEAKGGVTIISIIWHAAAVFAVQEIVISIFSGEWSEQVRRSGKVVLEETDAVSRVSSGYIDRALHFISHKATSPFRLSFICGLLLMILNGVGPSALTVSPVFLLRRTTIQVANMTAGALESFLAVDIVQAMERANHIATLEILENATYGYRSEQPNILIPWPSPNLSSTNTTIKYETDIITYNFSCSWQAPAFQVTDSFEGYWNISGHQFMTMPGRSTGRHSAISPDLYDPNDPSCRPTIVPLITFPMNTPGLGAWTSFLFVSNPETAIGAANPALGLGDLPTTPLRWPPGMEPNTSSSLPPTCINNPISALFCDPQYEIRPATVTLLSGSLTAEVRTGPPIVKNIGRNGVDELFYSSLYSAMSATDLTYELEGKLLSLLASVLFLGPAERNTSVYTVKPLPIDIINRNLNNALRSAAKAYLSGYGANSTDPALPVYVMADTNAEVEYETPALVGSRPFLITVVAVVCILIIMFVAIVVRVRVEELRMFDLAHIVETLGISQD